MPSFDIVSELDLQEVDNAVNQTSKEISQRFDFKGAQALIEFDKTLKTITLTANSEQKVENILSVLQSKAVKRGLDLRCFDFTKPTPITGGKFKSPIKLIEGIEKDIAKKIIKHIKDSELKVQASIHDDKLRVTGKKRDDLQDVIASVKAANFEVPLQFDNFRD